MSIKGYVLGSIFNAKENHVLIAINTEGKNNSGLAKEFAKKCWPELENFGKCPLSTVAKKEWNGKTIHALVCYSLNPEVGWKEAPHIIQDFLDDMVDSQLNPVAVDETVATVMMGQSDKSKELGANPIQIRAALQNSKRPVIIYTK